MKIRWFLASAGVALSIGTLAGTAHGQSVPRVIYSNIATSPTSDIPNDPMMRKFTNLRRPHGSASGMHWLLNAGVGTGSAVNLTIKGSGLTGQSVLLPGGALPWGATLNPVNIALNRNAGINDAGQWVISGFDNSGSATDAFIAADLGTGLAAVAREGTAAFGPGDAATWGGTLDSVSIDNAGLVSFYSTLANTTTTDALWHGMTLVVERGATIPTGQQPGFMDTISSIRNSRYYRSADGLTWIMGGGVGSDNSINEVIIVNNDIKAQEGVTIIPPFTSTVGNNSAGLGETQMGPDGNWFWRGAATSGTTINDVFVVRSGQVVAAENGFITPCSGEVWSRRGGNASFTFFLNVGNANGDYIVGGQTDNADVAQSGVFVLNGRKIVLRSDEPLDFDGDGDADMDDGLFIRSFIFDEAFLTPDLKLYITVDVKTAQGVQSSAGKAFIVKQLTAACEADFDCSSNVDATDIFVFLDAWFAQNGMSGPGLSADFNDDGTVDATDIFVYLDAWFAENGQSC